MTEKIAFNIQEAVNASGLCRTTLYGLMKSGELAYSQILGKRIILGAAIVDLVERNQVGA